MISRTLKEYVKLLMLEALARVPNQLVADTKEEPKTEETDDENDIEVKEFNVVGNIAGYTAPLGAKPDALSRKKNKK